jgi:hypothetical protein
MKVGKPDSARLCEFGLDLILLHLLYNTIMVLYMKLLSLCDKYLYDEGELCHSKN